MGHEQIAGFIEQLEKESNNIRKICIQHSWSMRGGAQYTDIMNMSSTERAMIADLSNENIETSQKSGLPFF